ncbi:hypothetical protein MNB_SM-7-773 [hydrothermal vent metagenome]|uniref:Uncharacterized protein n=1 Tax=hydrothermal vent metagenome TaxID=652676 RepID=A0A1W1C402_9ZZZZ
MRLFFTFLVTALSLYGAKPVELSSKYESAQKCKACHAMMVNDWSHSWHAKSHYNKDEYFRKSINFVAKKNLQNVNTVKIKCAKCHNPRISVTHVNDEYNAIAALGLDADTKVDHALKDKKISEGINCLVCHNIDKIHYNAPASVRGMDRIEWTHNGMMSGPFKDTKSPYHKTQYRSFFDKDPNKLCFVCHANDHSSASNKLIFTNMQKEYKGEQKCIECHMSKKHSGYATTYQYKGTQKKEREVRHHFFAGAHKEKMWKNALQLKLLQKKSDLIIKIINPQPHNIPSGFGGREIVVVVKLTDIARVTTKKEISLTTHYTRKRGRVSTPHMALKQSKDLSIPAKGKRVIRLALPKDTKWVKVTLFYRLANKEIRDLLHLQEPIWKKKFFITSKKIKLQ